MNKIKLATVILGSLCNTFYYSQVGINTPNPGSTLDVKGSFATPYKQVTATTYTFLNTDQYLDYRGAAISSWSLPAAIAIPGNFGGRIYEVRNGSAFDLTVTPNGTEKIDVSNIANGEASFTIPAGYVAVIKSTGNTSGSTWVVSLLTAGNTVSSANTSGFSTSILGYTPVKLSQRVVPATFGGVSVVEAGCKKWAGNGHTYCAYQLGGGKNFYDTFTLAKQIGGYITTITSNAERSWINTNILANTTGYNLNNSIWIGYNKVSYPGNANQFTWITGEDWTIDWTTSPNSTPENWFSSGEPNNSGGTEGSCHIFNSVSYPSRLWNDVSGSITVQFGAPFNQVILEFNED